jgi:cardiolipin synthase (CMP-forming)
VISQVWSLPNQITLLRLIFIPFIVLYVLDANYHMALLLFVLAGITDALDGNLARILKQKTQLGEYLDPIADKLLLSTLFLVLSLVGEVPWRVTVLVFSRDIGILVVSALLYTTASLRDFRPSIFGKINTTVQVLTLFFVLYAQVNPADWVAHFRYAGLWLTAVLTVVSAVHYALLVGPRLKAAQGS